MDILQEAIDEGRDLLVIRGVQSGACHDSIRDARRRRHAFIPWLKENTDQRVAGILPAEDLPLQDCIGAGSVRRDLEEVP